MKVKVQKWGNSQGIRIPKYILEEMNCTNETVFNIEIQNDTIVLKKTMAVYPEINLEKMFAEYDGEIPKGEIDWGNPQGDEIW